MAGAATSASTAEAATSPWTAGGITSTSAAEASADPLVSGALKGSPVLSIDDIDYNERYEAIRNSAQDFGDVWSLRIR